MDSQWKDEGNALKGTGAVEATPRKTQSSSDASSSDEGKSEADEASRSPGPCGNTWDALGEWWRPGQAPRDRGGDTEESWRRDDPVARTRNNTANPRLAAGCNRPAELDANPAEVVRNHESGASDTCGSVTGDDGDGREGTPMWRRSCCKATAETQRAETSSHSTKPTSRPRGQASIEKTPVAEVKTWTQSHERKVNSRIFEGELKFKRVVPACWYGKQVEASRVLRNQHCASSVRKDRGGREEVQRLASLCSR